MVEHPADYHWSSYQINALGRDSGLCTPHSLYLALGENSDKRRTAYQALFKTQLTRQTLNDIRFAANKGAAIGSDRFKQQIENLTGERITPLKMGRPTNAQNIESLL